ncbi:helix-turn-helix domain-containing protein [Gilvimarinus algae]|uniref:Helix-turn-helix domain-containing protein n=1 Tax=Gilvimarinus algae TaxID=3058037 RepID=A0ABT8TIC6_9GAMM|nr:helix-turn-helix domain-containing protein [Gilvimarinus sp. SDUM040014]MDO3383849.1 helix-turn-helix domain-containing protein [Gilvimarinus sp. SDUM040014]
MIAPNQPINLSVLPPVSSQEQFAQWLGITQDTVRGWVENNTVPNIKIGRQRFINITRLVEQLREGKTIFSRGDYSDAD